MGQGIAVADLPQLRRVLEGEDEAAARPRLVDGGDARRLSLGASHFAHLEGLERCGIEQHERAGEVVRDRENPPVMRDGEIARVDARPHLEDLLQAPEIVFLDPAVARGEIDESPIGAELGPAVEGAARGETGEARETVAVEDADVMVALLDEDEEVQGIGREDRLLRERRILDEAAAGAADLLRPPSRRRFGWREDVVREASDLRRIEQRSEGRHHGRRAAPGDDFGRLLRREPPEHFRQQGGTAAAETLGAVAGGAVVPVETGRIRLRGDGRKAPQKGEGEARREPPHGRPPQERSRVLRP